MVVLTWNEEKNIESCLRSLARQTREDFEVVVIDAASTDGTAAIVRSLAGSFPVPLRLHVTDTRVRVGPARNLGVGLARADLIAFLSADAEADEHWVEEALRTTASHDLTFGRQVHAPSNNSIGAAVRGLRYNFPDTPAKNPKSHASNANSVIRRHVLETFPFGSSAGESAVDDLLLVQRAAKDGNTIGYNPHMVVHHHDVDSIRAEFVKNLREGIGWGEHAAELGLHRKILLWGAALVAAVLAAALFPGLITVLFLAAVLWTPAVRRAWLRRKSMTGSDRIVGALASPAFDLAFLVAYLRGVVSWRHSASLPVRPSATSSGPRKTTLFLVIDAGRGDYVRPDSMPFLHALATRSRSGSVISPPGFAQRTGFYSGRYPDTSNNLSAFVFDPDHSPFKWLRSLGPVVNLIRPYKVFVPFRRAIRYISKWTSDCYHTDPAWIPTKFQPFFRPCEDSKPVHDPGALGATSIFDLCREHGKTYTYRAHPVSGNDDAIFKGLIRDLGDASPYDVYIAQFSIMDQQGHRHGPFTEEIQKNCLAELDRKIQKVHEALNENYEDWNLFVCADHGMAPVMQRLDVLKILKKLPLKAAKDYVVFVNSTLVVLWYLTERGRTVIEGALPSIANTRVISDEERRERRIPTNRQWGDRMLAANPGVLFWPDYFHVKDSTIRGMHGYLDKSEEQYGMAIIANKNGSIGPSTFDPRTLIDVFPTLCDLVGVPVPSSAEGRTLLEEPVRTRPAARPPDTQARRATTNAKTAPWSRPLLASDLSHSATSDHVGPTRPV